MEFEWDSEKELKNIRNHGISFETAVQIWRDFRRIERYDEKHSIDEERWQTIGMSEGMLFVVFTERAERIRIISARPADSDEENTYYGDDSFYIGHWYRANF